MYQKLESSTDMEALYKKRERNQELSEKREEIKDRIDVFFEVMDIPWDLQEYDRAVVKEMLVIANLISNLRVWKI